MREPLVRSEGFWADFLNGFFLRQVFRGTPARSPKEEDPLEGRPSPPDSVEEDAPSRGPSAVPFSEPLSSQDPAHLYFALDKQDLMLSLAGWKNEASLVFPGDLREAVVNVSEVLSQAVHKLPDVVRHAISPEPTGIVMREIAHEVRFPRIPSQATVLLVMKDAAGRIDVINPENHPNLSPEVLEDLRNAGILFGHKDL